MFEECIEKQNAIRQIFNSCNSEEDKYKKIIELGRSLPPLDPIYKTPENLVKGCQSKVYLRSYLDQNKVFFQAESDALISAGLAALLIHVYSGESPETILKCKPDFLEDLGISSSLSPGRSSGLYSIHLRLKQDALRLLMG